MFAISMLLISNKLEPRFNPLIVTLVPPSTGPSIGMTFDKISIV
jgi:hypothetical protein